MDGEQVSAAVTDRYSRKKEAIIAAATAILNRRGVKGMTLADVAASVDLITTSVTYYFKKKEDLAAACFLRAIERLDVLVTAAFAGADARQRLFNFVSLYLDMNRAIRAGTEAPLAMFNDLRVLREPHASQVMAPYTALVQKLVPLLDMPGARPLTRLESVVRVQVLLEQIYWSVTWLPKYDIEDYPRIRDRMAAILVDGIALEGAAWQPAALGRLTPPRGEGDTFLVAATQLINARGYRGASVEKISAKLNVTKGSFYHHNAAKDDLVVACFQRSFAVMRKAQSLALEQQGDAWTQLSSAAAALVEYQLGEEGPLLRSTALSTLPEPIRQTMVDGFNRVTGRFAAMISDGIAEGSLRPVDPAIAAQMLHATLNAVWDVKFFRPNTTQAEIAALYAKPILMGLLVR